MKRDLINIHSRYIKTFLRCSWLFIKNLVFKQIITDSQKERKEWNKNDSIQ